MGKNYYEFKDKTSSKFWEIEVKGSTVTVRYGKIGAIGHTTVKKMRSPGTAAGHAEKLTSAKLRSGYKEVFNALPDQRLKIVLKQNAIFNERKIFKKNRHLFFRLDTKITGVHAIAEKAIRNTHGGERLTLEECYFVGESQHRDYTLSFSDGVDAKTRRAVTKAFNSNPSYPWVEGFEEESSVIEVVGAGTGEPQCSIEIILLREMLLEIRGDRLEYCIATISSPDVRRLKKTGIGFSELFGQPEQQMFGQNDSIASKGFVEQSVIASIDGRSLEIRKTNGHPILTSESFEVDDYSTAEPLVIAWIVKRSDHYTAVIRAEREEDVRVELHPEGGFQLRNTAGIEHEFGGFKFKIWSAQAHSLGQEVDLEFQGDEGGYIYYAYIDKLGKVYELSSEAAREPIEDSDGEEWSDVVLTLGDTKIGGHPGWLSEVVAK